MMFQLLLGIFTDWLILSVLVYGAIYGIFRLLKYWFEKKQHKLRELLIHDDRLIKTDSQVWFYQRNNNSQGPVNQEKIKLLFRKGIIKSNTLLWIDGLDDWKPFFLFEYFHEIVISERVRKAYHLLLLGLLVIPLFLVSFRIFLFNLIFIAALFFFRWESYFQTSQKLSRRAKLILFSIISISIIALECVLFTNMLHNRSRLLDTACEANIRELNYRISKYAEAHNGRLPVSLESLGDDYINKCPTTSKNYEYTGERATIRSNKTILRCPEHNLTLQTKDLY